MLVVDEDVRALWDPWMVEADKLLEDEDLIELVYGAQGERHEHSATRGRSQTPAVIALRLLLLKHLRNWSFDTLEREVKMNLAYRDFTRIGLGKVPDAKTLARIAQALGGEVIAKLHEQLGQVRWLRGSGVRRQNRFINELFEVAAFFATSYSAPNLAALPLGRVPSPPARMTPQRLAPLAEAVPSGVAPSVAIGPDFLRFIRHRSGRRTPACSRPTLPAAIGNR